ncbi:hypothetical protein [Vibrio sp. D431a]|uniref:hypothetical protein n=1 Tax=Vibrio sp. D431a TaxID=2837388 RepID=UPI00255619C9|nr:hypothetical protein [Vibrio sp. D431a]MDK9790090.1 hypothetical protein [Vibrio sp. D431a]
MLFNKINVLMDALLAFVFLFFSAWIVIAGSLKETGYHVVMFFTCLGLYFVLNLIKDLKSTPTE